MTISPKNRPWIILSLFLVTFYAIIITSWAVFIHLAGKRETSRLTPEEAAEIYQKRQEQQQKKPIR